MQPLVSVIVPVYKVEDCLARCLDSLCRQSLSNIEIILVDDASPDRSGKICDAYAKKDLRFKVLHNKINQGLSMARNIGIANAYSDYLMFVDSDDWVHKDFCKDAYECAIRYHADLVMFRKKYIGYTLFFRFNRINIKPMSSGYKTCIEAIELLHKNVVGPAAWNKLYHKQLFKDITYPPGYLHEDVGTTYKTVWKATSIYYLDKVLYYKCYHAGSITTQKTQKSLNDYFEMFMQQHNDLLSWGYPTDKAGMLLKRIAYDYCIGKRPDDTDFRYVFCTNILLDDKGIPDGLSCKKKAMIVFFKYCRPLFELICIMFDKKVY